MSTDKVSEALVDFANAIEAAVAQLKHNLNATATPSTIQWNPDKITWHDKQGPNGNYQLSRDINNPDFKNMLQDLTSHEGRTNRGGMFYWVFPDGQAVARKPQTKRD